MKILIVIIFILFSSGLIFSQKSSMDYSTSKSEVLLNDSDNESYWSYSRSNFSVGWQSQFEPLVIRSHATFALSYSISNFFYSLQESKNQIGLFNEIGVNNMSVYLQAGPELRVLENIYVVPKIGASFAWIAGVHKGGIGFLYFYGGNIGYIYSLRENLSFYLESGADFIPIEETQGIYFGKIGISFKLF